MDQELRDCVRKLEDAFTQAKTDKSRAEVIMSGLMGYVLEHLTLESAGNVPNDQNRVLRERLQVLELGCATVREGLTQTRALNSRLLNILSQQASFSSRALDEAVPGASAAVGGPVKPATASRGRVNANVQPTNVLNEKLIPAVEAEDDEVDLIDLGGWDGQQFTEPLDAKRYVHYFTGTGASKQEESSLATPGSFDKQLHHGKDQSPEKVKFPPYDDHPIDDYHPVPQSFNHQGSRRNDLRSRRGSHHTLQFADQVLRRRAAEASTQGIGTDADSFSAEFYLYGVQFNPVRPINVYRSVIVTNLPSVITIPLLLTRVRGGAVYSVCLLDTNRITNCMSALIIFMSETAARAFVNHAHDHCPLLFLGRPALAMLVTTPTWPIPDATRRLKATRCVLIARIPESINIRHMVYDLDRFALGRRTVEHLRFDEDRSIHFRFVSVTAAVTLTQAMKDSLAYTGLDVRFEPDPCAEPLPEVEQTSGLDGMGDQSYPTGSVPGRGGKSVAK